MQHKENTNIKNDKGSSIDLH